MRVRKFRFQFGRVPVLRQAIIVMRFSAGKRISQLKMRSGVALDGLSSIPRGAGSRSRSRFCQLLAGLRQIERGSATSASLRQRPAEFRAVTPAPAACTRAAKDGAAAIIFVQAESKFAAAAPIIAALPVHVQSVFAARFVL